MFLLLFASCYSDECPSNHTSVTLPATSSYTSCQLEGVNFTQTETVSLTITSCHFINCFSENPIGGVISLTQAAGNTISISESTFEKCFTIGTYGGVLGVYNDGYRGTYNNIIDVSASDFIDCNATNAGAAIYAKDVYTCKVTQCKFIRFGASSGEGGAIWLSNLAKYNDSPPPPLNAHLEQCTFEPNEETSSFVSKVYQTRLYKCDFMNSAVSSINRSALVFNGRSRDATIVSCNFINNANTYTESRASSIHFLAGYTISVQKTIFEGNSNSANDILFQFRGKMITEFQSVTFVRTAAQSIRIDPTANISGFILFNLCCFYSKSGAQSLTPAYYKIEGTSKVKVIVDVTNCVDKSSKEEAFGTDVIINGDVFSCNYCQPDPPSYPAITPQPGTCPTSENTVIESDQTYSSCTFNGVGSRLIRMVNNDASITLRSCTFKNFYTDYEGKQKDFGGSVLALLNNFTKSIFIEQCTFDNCFTKGNFGGALYLDFSKTMCMSTKIINSNFNRCTSAKRGGVAYVRNVNFTEFIGCVFNNSKTLSPTGESGVLNFRVRSGNTGSGSCVVDGCTFENCDRAFASKIDVNTIKNSKFNNCYFSNPNPVGSCIFIQDKATSANLTVDHCDFTNSGFTDTTFDGKGGAIYSYDMNVATISYCNFENCLADSASAIYFENATLATIDHNTFTNCNGDIVCNTTAKVIISNNKFIKSYYRSSFYGKDTDVEFNKNCFQTKTDDFSYAHLIVIQGASTLKITSENCFDKPKAEAINVAATVQATIEDKVFSCADCSFLEEAEEGPNKKLGTPATIGIVVAAVVVVIIIIVVVVVVTRKKNVDVSDHVKEEEPLNV